MSSWNSPCIPEVQHLNCISVLEEVQPGFQAWCKRGVPGCLS